MPPQPTRSSLKRALQRVNVFQIDSVNVLVRSHYLPFFSRAGPYPRELLEAAAWGARSKRILFEYWAHEASLLPLTFRPLLEWRMERARKGAGMWPRMAAVRTQKKLLASIRRRIESEGPSTASSFKGARGSGSWWGWSRVKVALEYLFWAGELTAATRTSSFERVYDLTERVFSEEVLAAPAPEPTLQPPKTHNPSPSEAHRRLLLHAMQAMGVATEADLRDYFRLDLADARTALRDLVELGAIRATTVAGWKKPAYVLPATRVPSTEPKRSALLSPFDSLIWNRDRAHRLFEFHYRIEIYTPAHKRIHGYYVLPFLHDGRLMGRVDLKADRHAGALLVKGEHYESGVVRRDVKAALAAQLEALAAWLGLRGVER